MQASPCHVFIDFNRPIHTRPSNSSSAWKAKRAFWRGRFRVRPAEPVYVPRYKDCTKIGSVKRNHFWPRMPKLYPATSKNGDKATPALPVPSSPKTMFSKESFALSQKNDCLTWLFLVLADPPGTTSAQQMCLACILCLGTVTPGIGLCLSSGFSVSWAQIWTTLYFWNIYVLWPSSFLDSHRPCSSQKSLPAKAFFQPACFSSLECNPGCFQPRACSRQELFPALYSFQPHSDHSPDETNTPACAPL